MESRLTLGEKLKDLRTERKLNLAEVEAATGISSSTLQRMEADGDTRVGYQDIEVLTRFYDVSADYLFGLTDLRRHRNTEVDRLRLSDEAISVLTEGNLNNRLISEFIAHDDFPQLLRAMEIYIDRKILPQMSAVNTLYKLVEQTLKENTDISEGDEWLAFLQNSVIDNDEYLLYRISERYNALMVKLFDAHKKDKLPPEQSEFITEIKDVVEVYLDTQKTEAANKAKATALCKQLGLNAAKLTDEEWRVLMKTLERSEILRRVKRRR